MRQLFSSDFFNFEFTRILGTAPTLGADVAECFEAASKVRENDGESWYQAWSEAAELAESEGQKALASGDRQSALWALLRASNYRRTSEFMLIRTPTEPRLFTAISKAVENFQHACEQLDSLVVTLEIPYGETKLPAYLFLPKRDPNDQELSPLMSTGGFNSTQKELYHFISQIGRPRPILL